MNEFLSVSPTTELRGVFIVLDRKRNNLGGLGGGFKLQLRLNAPFVSTTSGRRSLGRGVLSSRKGGSLICFLGSGLSVLRNESRCQNLQDGWRVKLLTGLSSLLLFVGFASSAKDNIKHISSKNILTKCDFKLSSMRHLQRNQSNLKFVPPF